MTVNGRAKKAAKSLHLDVLSTEELEAIAQAMEIHVYSHGEHVVEVSDTPKMLWMIAEGQAWSTKVDVTSKRYVHHNILLFTDR